MLISRWCPYTFSHIVHIWDGYVSQALLKASRGQFVCFGRISVISIIALDESCLKLCTEAGGIVPNGQYLS